MTKMSRGRGDGGFTLIELMVVVLILAILIAIAIPTFLTARNSADARVAQTDLHNAMTAERTERAAVQSFSADPTTIQGIHRISDWTTSPASTGVENQVSVLVGDGGDKVLVGAQGGDGN